jgi:hypothetical protein
VSSIGNPLRVAPSKRFQEKGVPSDIEKGGKPWYDLSDRVITVLVVRI